MKYFKVEVDEETEKKLRTLDTNDLDRALYLVIAIGLRVTDVLQSASGNVWIKESHDATLERLTL